MIETRKWDPAEHLTTPEDIAAYLSEALEYGDPELMPRVLADIERARAMHGLSPEP